MRDGDIESFGGVASAALATGPIRLGPDPGAAGTIALASGLATRPGYLTAGDFIP